SAPSRLFPYTPLFRSPTPAGQEGRPFLMVPDDEHVHPCLQGMRAGVFDLDGVVTDTAALHAAAWKELFDTCLRERARVRGETFRPFTGEDYRRHVDGRPRHEGVRCFLASRGITLPDGDPEDPPGDGTIRALGNRKNLIFRGLLAAGGVRVFGSSVAFIRALRARGLRTALVSSSRNAEAVLASSGGAGSARPGSAAPASRLSSLHASMAWRLPGSG